MSTPLIGIMTHPSPGVRQVRLPMSRQNRLAKWAAPILDAGRGPGRARNKAPEVFFRGSARLLTFQRKAVSDSRREPFHIDTSLK